MAGADAAIKAHKLNTQKSGEPESTLFAEVNQLRKPQVPEVDREAREKAKLNNSICGSIAKSKKFEYLTLSIIVLNAGFIGYNADYSARFEAPENLYDCTGFKPSECYQFIIFENFFAVYFTFEVVVRFFSYRKKSDMLRDGWFIFDSILVLMMVIETWVLPIVGASGPLAQMSILRLLRLLRITRMAKLMRFFPELQIIVKGMVAAVRSVLCTGILLVCILYVWAILFTSEYHQGDLADDDDNVAGKASALFGSMGKSMRHLFIMGTILDDLTLCCNYIRSSDTPWTMLACFIIFILISSFTMLNMLIGILCEVVCATGEGERKQNSEMHVREAITDLFVGMDKDGNGEISREEFMSMKRDNHVMSALQELEVKAKHFEMYADLMFKPEEEGGKIPTFDNEEMLNMIMRLRPGTKVSSLDFSSFQMSVHKNHCSLKNHITNIEKMASVLTGKDVSAAAATRQMSRKVPAPSKDDKSPGMPGQMSASMLPELAQAPEQEIIEELQRRLGSFAAVG